MKLQCHLFIEQFIVSHSIPLLDLNDLQGNNFEHIYIEFDFSFDLV